jgi:hypothetical protein
MEAMHEVYGSPCARESEGANMNRQARLEGSKEWNSYGDRTFFQAIRKLAIDTSDKHGIGTWVIECRCESDPENIETYEVQTSIHAEILNPRNGDL